jgi:hypothetical protein
MTPSRRMKRNPASHKGAPVSNELTLVFFIAAIFVSATLLFAVQPMFTKMVLPRLGGSASVWSVAMVFFQAILLAGYAYAHLLTRYLTGRYSIVIHIVVMLIATLVLPLTISAKWGRPPAQGEAFYLIGLFTASVGLPFFALAANAPLLQVWFSRTSHPSAKDPYFLYAASNVGSFLALLSYPLVIEPLSRLGDQTSFWSFGFYGLIVLIAICGALLWPRADQKPASSVSLSKAGAPSWRDALIWTALAAVPSAFLLAVTSHISTDVAASPLLWVLPLALYLLTFVIVFQRKPIIPHSFALAAQPPVIVLLVGIYYNASTDQILVTILLNLAAFFLTALVCHGELARRRPPARYLTIFYLCMSFGGMIGGIFSGLIAPNIFSWVAEYPILIVAGLLCRPGIFGSAMSRPRVIWLCIFVLFAAAVIYVMGHQLQPSDTKMLAIVACMLLVSIILLRDSLKLAAVVALILFVSFLDQWQSYPGGSVRSFFGVHKVFETYNGQYRVLMHGTTIHGAERIPDEEEVANEEKPVPLTYYHAKSPMAAAIDAVRSKKPGPLRAAVVGLGSGSLACYFKEGDTFNFYEIDQSIVDLATDPGYFTYYSSCAPDAKIILGDARLTMTDAKDGSYDIIIVDAFTSDAIPIHLMTKEAMATYLAKLAPHGMIVLHISNRHMELGSVVAGIAKANGLTTRISYKDAPEGEDTGRYIFTSTVTASARSLEDFGSLVQGESAWTEIEPDAQQWVWTDDYSNVVGAMLRHMNE